MLTPNKFIHLWRKTITSDTLKLFFAKHRQKLTVSIVRIKLFSNHQANFGKHPSAMATCFSILISLFSECILAHAESQNLKYLHLNAIDNILTKIADPYFLGFFIQEKLDLSFKFVSKVQERENVGLHVIREDGTFGVLGFLKRVRQFRRFGKGFKKRKRWPFIQSISHPNHDREYWRDKNICW